MQVSSSSSRDEQEIWRFIGATYDANPRAQFVDLLGFNPDKVAEDITR